MTGKTFRCHHAHEVPPNSWCDRDKDEIMPGHVKEDAISRYRCDLDGESCSRFILIEGTKYCDRGYMITKTIPTMVI